MGTEYQKLKAKAQANPPREWNLFLTVHILHRSIHLHVDTARYIEREFLRPLVNPFGGSIARDLVAQDTENLYQFKFRYRTLIGAKRSHADIIREWANNRYIVFLPRVNFSIFKLSPVCRYIFPHYHCYDSAGNLLKPRVGSLDPD